MARTPTGTLGTHFTSEATTLARLMTIVKSDNSQVLLTDHDADITIDARALAAGGTLTLADTDPSHDTVAQIAFGSLNITSGNNALNAETVTIGVRVYTFETAFSDTADFVLIGVDRSATLLNLANAINNGAGEGTTYGTGTTVHADVTAIAPNQSSSSGIIIDQGAGTVVGNMTIASSSLGRLNTNEQSFNGNTNEWSSQSSSKEGPGDAFIGKDFSAAPHQIHSARVFGSRNVAWWSPSGQGFPSLAMFFELRAKVGAAPVDDAAYFTDGTVLGTVGPFIVPVIGLSQPDLAPDKFITSSDKLTEWDHVWITLSENRNDFGFYFMGEVLFSTVVVTAGAGDMALEAKVAGFAGNLIGTVEGLTDGSWGGALLTGGSDIFFNSIDAETVTIGSKVYTFEDLLSDVDGNVHIGADAEETLGNLIAGINLDAGAGSKYATSMTGHPDVTAVAGSAVNTMVITADVAGNDGNTIDTTETLTEGSWGVATLTGGFTAIYAFVPGFTASAALSSSLQGIQGLAIEMPEENSAITQTDLNSGVYTDAQITIEYVNWADPQNGFMIIFAGVFGENTNTDEGELTFEIQGKFTRNRQMLINVYQPSCRADLGDSLCLFDIGAERREFTIDTVISQSVFQTTQLTQDDDFWKLGVVRFITGNNAGVSIEVMASKTADGEISMFLPAPLTMQAGDTGEIWPGCDKTLLTCRNRFDNVINFRGEPFAPQEGNMFAFKG